jgi:hypothetical protein
MAFDPTTARLEGEATSGFDPSTARELPEGRPESWAKKFFEEEAPEMGRELGRGAALTGLGLAQSVPIEPVQKWATEKIQEIKAIPEMERPIINPRTLGQVGAEVGLAYVPGAKAYQATKGLATLPRFAAQTGLGAALAGGTAGLTKPVSEYKDIQEQKLGAAKEGAIVGGILSGTLPLAAMVGKAGYKKAYDIFDQAFSGDARRMADELKRFAEARTGAEAEAARTLAAEAERKASMAATAGEKAAVRQDIALREVPGATTQAEAGRFKPVPESEEAIGSRIRGYVDNLFNQLKKARNDRAEANKAEAFGFALQKEQGGQRVKDTNAYAEVMKEIKDSLTNPDTKLTNMPIQEVRSQLQKVASALEGKAVDPATGMVVGRDVSFEGLEQMRRFLNDRAYGLPAEGFDAISQQQAGRLAKSIERVMSEFSEGRINKFIDQYKRDSEPMRAFQTKIGKALTAEQVPGSTGYAVTAAESLPAKVFGNKDSYRAFLETVGNNQQYAQAEAKKYFASKLEALGNDPKRIEDFIRANRTMLTETGSKDMVEGYLRNVRMQGRRGEAALKIGTEAGAMAESKRRLADAYATFQSDINVATDPTKVSGLYKNFSKKMLDEGAISQQQYRTMVSEADRVAATARRAEEAKGELAMIARRIGGIGLLGGAAAVGIREFGGLRAP